MRNEEILLQHLRNGEELTFRDQIELTIRLSLPAIMAQLSFIIMEYIDASMVGSLGPNASASIGLVCSSTWLFGGVCTALTAGFTVQAAQQIGAKDEITARNTVKNGLLVALVFSLFLALGGFLISGKLPVWLGGNKQIITGASRYFMIYALSLPFVQLNALAGGMLQSSGNMRVPSMLHILMCLLDIIFNSALIFPTRIISIAGKSILVFGAGLGVTGAALGTAFSEAVIGIIMFSFLAFKSPLLKFRAEEKFVFSGQIMKRAVKIALPIGFEQAMMSGAQVACIRIVSPLGTIAIASNSFAVTAESLCYMPGFGIGTAAATMIGQSIGAGQKKLSKKLGYISTGLCMLVMGISAMLMYFAAPFMIGLLSPDESIRQLGASILRIEAFAEPLYGASIVASGVLRGAGDTLIPSLMTFSSMWFVRIPLAAFLAPRLGLKGVWLAMCTELCVRGIIFLIRLKGGKWLEPHKKGKCEEGEKK